MSPPATTAEKAPRSEASILNGKLASTGYFDTVSKRSVERHYYPEDPQYFRHFVKKPQRRSSLLNRLYLLRSKAVQNAVLGFLRQCTEDSPKTVINLGCGSDVLPWTLNHRYFEECKGARFIDIDFPSVIRSKRSTILQIPALLELLGGDYHISKEDGDPLMLQSAKYCQIGCDFTDNDILRNTVGSLIISESRVLIVAEMSLMYNDVESTEKLLSWARTGLQADFCLFEHCFPGGTGHPLAVKLLQDYHRGQTPLRTSHAYPTVNAQQQRFRTSGWKEVSTLDLWDVWTHDDFFDSFERDALEKAEPFDDWEDLILLARHFFILSASDRIRNTGESAIIFAPKANPRTPHCFLVARHDLTKSPKRRFGGLFCDTTTEGAELVMSMLGENSTGLSDNYDALTSTPGNFTTHLPTSGPSPRSHFTVTDLGRVGVIVIGGKSTAVNKPLSDCWLYHRGPSPSWKKTWDLPHGIHRHFAVRLGGSSMVLVMGGKNARGISSECFVFHPQKGWHRCAMNSPYGPSLFGASVWQSPADGPSPFGEFQGLLCGGLDAATKPNLDMFRWHLDTTTSEPAIYFEIIKLPGRDTLCTALFGATVVATPTQALLVGGVGTGHRSDYLGQTIVTCSASADAAQSTLTDFSLAGANVQWPLMIGSSATSYSGCILVLGGGVAAYPQGSLWNDGIHVFDFQNNGSRSAALSLRLLESPKLTSRTTCLEEDSSTSANTVALTPVPRIRLKSSEDFRTILLDRKPVIIEGLDLGTCLDKWTPQYLCDQVGVDTKVTVHESTSDSPRLDFSSKNFKYVTESFGKVISKMQDGGRMYLRALSRSKPSDTPANLEDDFPSLALDFKLPKELDLANDSVFSSILRLSGRANMWLHYDVMANIYTQIRGTKQMILFPPRDATRLDFAPGASSSSFDVFSALGTKALAGTQPFEAILGPGDALFLPAAWLHAASPWTDMSVAVNVFFRDLDGGYAEGRDVYGNRDLAAYEKGRLEAARIAQTFRNVPQDMRQFYLSRIAEELRQLAETP